KADNNTLSTNPVMGHGWSDLFYGDETGNDDQVDFSKVQQFFLTVVLVVAYAIGIIMILLHPAPAPGTTGGSPILYFPPLDPGLSALRGVSKAPSISYKAAPHTKTAADDAAAPAKVGGADIQPVAGGAVAPAAGGRG